MRSIEFFETHPVFTHSEFAEAHSGGGQRSRHTSNNLLAKHVAAGRILRVRRGLYATVSRGLEAAKAPVDPYLVATKLTDDAVVAYHAALQFHGRAYSLWRRFHHLARGRNRRFSFLNLEFVPVQVPAAVRDLPNLGGGIVERRHSGGVVRVTTLERTLVDVLDAPYRCGGWEEVWRSLEMVEFFDLDAVIDYTRKLASSLTAARVGFFLDQHREALMAEGGHLDALRELAPSAPRYLDSKREPGQLVSAWNLIVPQWVLAREWSEIE